MKRFFTLLLLISICLLTSCTVTDDVEVVQEYPVTVDGVTFDESPMRVVSLSPSLTETVYMLGYGSRLVGVSDNCDRPTIPPDVRSCGTALTPYVEGILELSPDLVVSSSALPSSAVATLIEAGVAVIVVTRGETTEELLENYGKFTDIFSGTVTGALKQEQLAYYIDVTLGYIFDSMSAYLAEDTSAIYLRAMDFTMATGDSFEGWLLRELGFINQAEQYTNWSYPLEYEPELNPDYIFLADIIDRTELTESDYYNQTTAVMSEQIIELDPQVLERQSPMMFDYLESVLREHFPEAFVSEKPSIVMPQPTPPPEPEPTWWEEFLGMFS